MIKNTIVTAAILDQIGLGGLDTGYLFIGMTVLLLVLIILIIVQIVKYSRLKKRMDRFMSGANAKSLEKDIGRLYDDNRFLKESYDQNKRDILELYKKMKSTYQKTGLVKYDAFNQVGGKLSFCLALLDENNDGFVINTVHSSEGCYFYAKEIKKGESEISLGEEEKQALEIAMK